MAPNHVHSKSMPPTSFTLLIKLKSLFPIYSIKLWLHHYRIYVGHKFQLNRKFMQDLLTQLNFNYDNVLRSQLASYSLVNYRPLALFTLFRQEGEFKINQECRSVIYYRMQLRDRQQVNFVFLSRICLLIFSFPPPPSYN